MMLRALSTRRSYRGYEKLEDDPSIGLLEGKLKRANSVAASRVYAIDLVSRKSTVPKFMVEDKKMTQNDKAVKTKSNKKANKSHPIFSFFDIRRKKKATSKAEFARYLEYVKEGGVWDNASNMPVIYYK